ncbi:MULTISPECIES: type II secretion system protein GspM [Vibrio]|uniref:type II secretion system protein GspM n=1 Tax=Vibrio TaxID=662 RepID=UPI000A1017FF|nr:MULTISPECIES: type II secretion system protein GspM [Vibrio]EGR5061224.1 MSHA biogenesis protein MshJ [Vibrio cholerae]MCX9473014.1 type 4a pilus biogenesis protein PilO [Vibrio cholerae]MCX9478360.1 type 4a pilus biogenesis protein PilO [Vibrio cholerae]MDP4495898.1 type II secretion system protein GspM [Vibrio cholerae]ORP12977.1 MSHA biogenesis protein MshJ [Vibrio paracholerae]
MKSGWQNFESRFSALSQREKVLITLCGSVLIVMMLLLGLIEPALKQGQARQLQMQTLTSSNQQLQGEIMALQAQLAKNPDQELDVELSQLTLQSQEISELLAAQMTSMVAASEMPNLLESVLKQGQQLKLVSLESLPAEPIVRAKESGSESEYYIHPVRMELTGSYFAIRDYLQALEALPVKYYWRHFHYRVESYPQARVILEVYTLGSREEFIGG